MKKLLYSTVVFLMGLMFLWVTFVSTQDTDRNQINDKYPNGLVKFVGNQ